MVEALEEVIGHTEVTSLDHATVDPEVPMASEEAAATVEGV